MSNEKVFGSTNNRSYKKKIFFKLFHRKSFYLQVIMGQEQAISLIEIAIYVMDIFYLKVYGCLQKQPY